LTLDDIDLDRSDKPKGEQLGFMRVMGSRTRKERMVPLNAKARLALEKYLDIREATETNILFLNRFGEPVSDRGVQKMLRKYLKRTGIAGASIHTLRHTFGVYQLAKGVDLKTVQGMMGHKDGRSTTPYITLAREVNN
jgi:site-specific recombinase XerD